MRDGFIFYKSFHDAASSLPDEIRLKVYDMIIEYALTGVEPSCSGIEKTIFILVKPQLDANTRRYENGKKGAKHGSKGGRPKTPKEPQEHPTEPPKEKEKEKEKVKEKEEIEISLPAKAVTKKGSRLPDDWDCSEALGEWALGEGLTRKEVITEIDNFTDYYKALTGKGSTALDWDAKFRTWIRNQVKWKRERKVS